MFCKCRKYWQGGITLPQSSHFTSLYIFSSFWTRVRFILKDLFSLLSSSPSSKTPIKDFSFIIVYLQFYTFKFNTFMDFSCFFLRAYLYYLCLIMWSVLVLYSLFFYFSLFSLYSYLVSIEFYDLRSCSSRIDLDSWSSS